LSVKWVAKERLKTQDARLKTKESWLPLNSRAEILNLCEIIGMFTKEYSNIRRSEDE
jgi:hypothetical protein